MPALTTPATTLALLLALTAAASASVFSGASGSIRLSPPRVARAPVVDGRLDDPAWAEAAVLDRFTHGRPVEGVRDTLGTTALVMYDDQHLYIAFRAGDDPRKVQAPVVPRDQVWQGDWVGVSIDTYNDHQRSFFFCASPIGIQMDGVDQDGGDTDMAPDLLYTSKGRVTPQGYEVEMAIPFKTLRFAPSDHVTFGFNAIRDVKRNGTHMYWAPITRNINSYHAQLGSLQSLEGVRPGRNLELSPTHTTSTLATRDNGPLAYDAPHGRFGLAAKYGITSNLITDVAMTPDFSQVEADAGALDVNERFATFFPEKRPFFLEGAGIFVSPIDLVYTRRIADPLYGAKLTGKVGHTSIGVLQAADRGAGHDMSGLPRDANPYADHDAFYTIARFKQDVLKNSYIGLLAGDRTQRDQYNRGAGLDGRINWANKYSFTFQGVQSWSADRDYGAALARLDSTQLAAVAPPIDGLRGARREGSAWHGELRRDTRHLNVSALAHAISPEFAAEMGFIQRRDHMDFSLNLVPHIVGKERSRFTDIRPIVYYQRIYNYSGSRRTDEAASFILEGDFPNASWAGTENNRRYILLGTTPFRDIVRHAVWAGTNRWRGVRPDLVLVWGDQIVYAEGVRGRDVRWEANSDLRFSTRFDGSLSIIGNTVWRDDGTRYAHAFLPRLRLSYQFSKELSLRVTNQMRLRKLYDTSGAETSRTQTLAPDVLFSYYLRPGTVVYVGYGTLLAGSDLRTIEPTRGSVFTKLSYLWQM